MKVKATKEEVKMGNGINNSANLPAEVSVWSKVRNFLCQDVEVTLGPKQEQVFQAGHEFWCDDITGLKVHEMLLDDFAGEKVKNFLFQEIEITDNIEL